MQKTRKTKSVVRRNITDALFELMAEKPFDDITVTELVARAHVARVSFYRNFESKEDVVKCESRRVTDEWLERVGGKELLEADPRALCEELFLHVYSRRDQMDLYMRSGLMEIVRSEFDRAFGVDCEDRRVSAVRAFVAGGMYNLCLRWAARNYEPSPEVLADFVYKVLERRK